MKKTKGMIIAFSSMLVSTLALSVVTFAWIDYNQTISDIHITAGSLSVSNLTATTYKYVYPYYKTASGSDGKIINYDGTGIVTEFTPTKANPRVSMNILDPTYITIVMVPFYGESVHSQADVSRMNTNLVFKVSFTLSYATKTDFSFVAKRNSSFAHNPTPASGSAKFGI